MVLRGSIMPPQATNVATPIKTNYCENMINQNRHIGNTYLYNYNGKELDRMRGLDWYNYGTRHCDAAVGRWHTMDPLAEKYYNVSPYAYCANGVLK